MIRTPLACETLREVDHAPIVRPAPASADVQAERQRLADVRRGAKASNQAKGMRP
jgi:hypothetical protein